MIDHHIQRQILYQLAFADSLRFADLQPDGVENKLFTYHLKKLVTAKLITKREDGTYTLTAEGRRVGKNALTTRDNTHIDRAYSILLIALRNKDSWLLYKRHTHPLINLYGFMQARPIATTPVVETAQQTCLAETGLRATFATHGSGYIRVYRDKALESFIHFTLIVGTYIEGEFVSNSEFGTYEWVDSPDFSAENMLPNMSILHNMCESAPGSFIDEVFHV